MRLWQCPSLDQTGYRYASNIAGWPLGQLGQQADTVSFFESLDGDNLVQPHSGGSNFAYLDGHVAWSDSDRRGYQRVDPPVAPEAGPTGSQATVSTPNGNGVNLRARPDNQSEPLGRLPDGSRVTILEKQGDWAHCELDGGTQCWTRWRYEDTQYLYQ